ncbi:MAG: tlde1 domain-containing protein [Xanthobacteraceae bacterium]
MAFGVGATVISASSIATVAVGGTWIFAASRNADADIRSAATFVPPSNPQVKLALAAGEAALPVAVADAPETVPSADARTASSTVALAFAALMPPVKPENPLAGTPAKPAASQDRTGSIAVETPKLASLGLASVDTISSTPDVAQARPSPRAAPKLASLTPPTDLGTVPEEDTRSQRTAIYDITAQAVYLPSGEKLEAHSGLGDLMDDPRHVHRRMRGATPPNSYRLSLRESLFHGVRAIRLTPEDDGKMYGRDGILAHTYMLGPNGQSNGCVSFKDYQKFLKAYLRGEVDRMVVVARLPKPPRFYARAKSQGAGKTL